MNYRLKWKLLEENMGEMLQDIWMGKDFCRRSQKYRKQKQKQTNGVE
jgi:hypothetical protein